MVELVDAVRPVVGWLVGIMLTVAALLTLVRIAKGPSVLNRTLASDVLVTTLLCGIAAEATLERHGSTIPIMVSLSLVAVVGSVAVSRFVARDSDTAEACEDSAPIEPAADLGEGDPFEPGPATDPTTGETATGITDNSGPTPPEERR